MRLIYIAFTLVSLYSSLNAQSNKQVDSSAFNTHNRINKILNAFDHFSIEGYGSVNHNNYKWQTDTAKRNDIDLERFVLEPTFRFSKNLKLNAELEIEHGGTGTAVEFDRFEEFGEFEFEIEKGGEVNLEQLNIEWNYNEMVNLKAGRIKVPVGFYYQFDEPVDYFTPTVSEVESHLLPTSWTEFGISIYGKLGKNKKLNYVVGIVNGLDNSAFSSSTWIKRGNQQRFETVNAVDWSGVLRLEYEFNDHLHIGTSGYFGNSTDNRPKPDLKVPGYVGIVELHTAIEFEFLEAKALILYGRLSNAKDISDANRNLSNNLNVKRTPVGSSVLGAYCEIGTDLLNILHPGRATVHQDKMMLYGRVDYYDTMYTTEGNIFNNPRWERQVWGIGLNYQPIKELIIKTYYSSRKFGIPQRNLENTFTLGFGFAF